MKITNRQSLILIHLSINGGNMQELLSVKSLSDSSERTLQRELSALQEARYVDRHGDGKLTRYTVSVLGKLMLVYPVELLDNYFRSEDRPEVSYDFSRLDLLSTEEIFDDSEKKELVKLDSEFRTNFSTLPGDLRKRELERITIELAWKSSQLEGNTYSLLETESLLKDGQKPSGRSEFETQMIINHKNALVFAQKNSDLFVGKITIQLIIELHKILVDKLDISHKIRDRLVAITGSAYRPLGNPHQIADELQKLCDVINAAPNVITKSLLAYVHISYLQPFNDGNKRTGRIMANALQVASGSFPLSLRALDATTYKLAILSYYEFGSIGNAKDNLLEQARYAVGHYSSKAEV
jgi:DNA-binding transcriptional ArsR family regulator/fido (protein-threonine AMPylation protein)